MISHAAISLAIDRAFGLQHQEPSALDFRGDPGGIARLFNRSLAGARMPIDHDRVGGGPHPHFVRALQKYAVEQDR